MIERILESARAAALAGGEVLERQFRSGVLETSAKAEHDFVTSADRESEAAIVAEIRRRYPDHRILAEEGGSSGDPRVEHEWVIDPLDGTTNFLQGLPIYAVSVACRRGGEVLAGAIHDPAGGNLFLARRGGGATWNGRPMAVSRRPGLHGAFLATGYPFRAREALDLYLRVFQEAFAHCRAIRRCGAAALDLAYTAAGVYDAFFEFQLSPWDLAAGALMVEEAGGRVSDLDGRGGMLESGNVVAGAPGVQRELLAALRRHVSEETLRERLGAESVARV